jgi:hypothetical protein
MFMHRAFQQLFHLRQRHPAKLFAEPPRHRHTHTDDRSPSAVLPLAGFEKTLKMDRVASIGMLLQRHP